MKTNFINVTEVPGNKASKEQLERLYQRYCFAAQFCKGKDVFEAACGAGQGLGYLARTAKHVVGGDVDETCLSFARSRYIGRPNIRTERFDAQKIPYPDGSFDTVLLYEAIYYIPDAGRFMDEAFRVLRENGMLVICTVNKDWADFNPSPYSVKYFSLPELAVMLKKRFGRVESYGGFPTAPEGVKDMAISFIKRAAVALHLVPKTMKGRELLKRLVFGKLYPLPAEVTPDMAEYRRPVMIPSDKADSAHKVLFAIAYKTR